MLSFFHCSYDSSPLNLSNMEAIKKKMQAMKVIKMSMLSIKALTTHVTQVEKDNACDRVDVSEEQCKAARVKIHSSFYAHTGAIFFHIFPTFDLCS